MTKFKTELVLLSNKFSKSLITSKIYHAMSYKSYIKFQSSKYWILVSFYRDNTIAISSNCTDRSFLSQMFWVRDHYSLNGLANLVTKWCSAWNR